MTTRSRLAPPSQGISAREAIQEQQYEFPYHYLPHVHERRGIRRTRSLSWGHEYLAYLHRMRDIVTGFGPRSILDVGCGDGRLLGLLKQTGARCVGVDASERAISFARAFHPAVEFHAGDLANVEGAFDVVVAMEVLEHIPDEGIRGFLRAIETKVAPAGRVVLSVPTTNVRLHRKHYRHYDVSLLQRQLSEARVGLEIETVEYVCRRSRVLDFYVRSTINEWWTIEVRWLEALAWWYMRRYSFTAHAGNGKHLIAVLRKQA